MLERRDEVVAAKITEYLKATEPLRQDHRVLRGHRPRRAHAAGAEQRQRRPLRAANPLYVVQITGDNPEGKAQLDNFIDPEKRYPVIATTSKLMSTGVDAQTCKLIVLDQNIKSMTLVQADHRPRHPAARGPRQDWFTILDFKRATELFADPAFDGEPCRSTSPRPTNRSTRRAAPTRWRRRQHGRRRARWHRRSAARQTVGDAATSRRKYIVGGIVNVSVARERVQYLNAEGKLITESLRDYTRINVMRQVRLARPVPAGLERRRPQGSAHRGAGGRGVFLEALADEVGKDLDPFDLLLHVAYDMPPLTRRERARAT